MQPSTITVGEFREQLQEKPALRVLDYIGQLIRTLAFKKDFKDDQKISQDAAKKVLSVADSLQRFSYGLVGVVDQLQHSPLPLTTKSSNLLAVSSLESLQDSYKVEENDFENAFDGFQPSEDSWQGKLIAEESKPGKVRDNFTIEKDGRKTFVSVATDRQSANNIPNVGVVPYKGVVLTEISNFWKAKAKEELGIESDLIDDKQIDPSVTVAKKLTPLPVEVVVRDFLDGTGWNRYKKEGVRDFGTHTLAEDLQRYDRLSEPIIDPTTKGKLDKPISDAVSAALVGKEDWTKVKEMALLLFKMGQEYAAARGLTLADTKYEFAKDDEGKIYLIDEVMTPDSSRYWLGFKNGKPVSMDKDGIRKEVSEMQDKGRGKDQIKVSKDVLIKAANDYIKVRDMLIDSSQFSKPSQNPLDRVTANLRSLELLKAA